MLAPGATLPATSISSCTSPSAPEESPVGDVDAAPTDTAARLPVRFMPFSSKYFAICEASNPPPSSISAIVCPRPERRLGNCNVPLLRPDHRTRLMRRFEAGYESVAARQVADQSP